MDTRQRLELLTQIVRAYGLADYVGKSEDKSEAERSADALLLRSICHDETLPPDSWQVMDMRARQRLGLQHNPAFANPTKLIHIYTDGSAQGNPGPGGWAYIIVQGREITSKGMGHVSHTTSNAMEILAAIRALDSLPGPCQVRLFSDSQYLINTMLFGWKKRANLELWKRLEQVKGRHSIEWIWVRGHNGNHYNEYADELARDAARNGQQDSSEAL